MKSSPLGKEDMRLIASASSFHWDDRCLREVVTYICHVSKYHSGKTREIQL